MRQSITFGKADHALDLINRLYEMRMEKRHCDFVIKVGSERIPAHRNVLTAMSAYFDRMLYHDTIENSSGMVDMKGVDPDCVRMCVDFIYGREVEVSYDKYEDLMHVANLMQLNKLVKIVENIIGQNLCMTLFFTSKRIADMYACEALQSECKEFALENFFLLSSEDEFVDLDKSYVTEIIKSRSVMMTEEEKFDAILRWAEHDTESRSKDLAHVLECIDLRLVFIESRQQLVHRNYLKDNVTSVRILCSSIINSLKFIIKKRREKAIVVFDNKSGHLQQFRPRTNSWTQMHQMNDDMEEESFVDFNMDFSSAVYADRIYAFTNRRKLFCLNYLNDDATWEEVAHSVENHNDSPDFVVQGRLFNEMEVNVDWLTKCFDSFNPKTMKWTELRDKGKLSPGSALLVIQDYIYIFGGTEHFNDAVFNDVWRFDPITSEWKEMEPMREAKDHAAAVELDDKAYVMGGNNGETDLSSLECYDPETNQWTTLAPMLRSRSWFKAFAVDGCIYAVGGFICTHEETIKIEKYDVGKNEWTMVPIPSGMELEILDSVEIQLE